MKHIVSLFLTITIVWLCFTFGGTITTAEAGTVYSDTSWANAYYKFLSTGEFWNGIVESFGVLIDPAVTGVGESIDPSSYPEIRYSLSYPSKFR